MIRLTVQRFIYRLEAAVRIRSRRISGTAVAHVIGIEHDLICTELIYGHIVILKRLRNHVESDIDVILFRLR